MVQKAQSKSKSTAAKKAKGQFNSDDTGSIAYNPNQEANLSTKIPMPDGWGSGEIESNLSTCQETLRQMYSATMQTVTDKTNTVDSSGIHDLRHSDGGGDVGMGSEKTTPPDAAVSPALKAGEATGDETGIPTGIEDKVAEQIEEGLEKLREILEDLDVTISIKNVADGKEIHFRSSKGGAVPTSEETQLPVEILKEAKYEVSGSKMATSDKNMAHIESQTGDETVRIATIGSTGDPTADETGTASVVLQSKNDLEQKGLMNNFVGVQVSVTLGPLFNVQTNV